MLSDANALPALEALACATPVVASAVGALPEVIGRAGILVEPESPERLATAIGVLVRGEPGRDGDPTRGRSGGPCANRTWDDVARETGHLRRGLAARRLNPRRALPTGPARAPASMTTFEPIGTTWMNVWPGVSAAGRPLASRKTVGDVFDFFDHVPGEGLAVRGDERPARPDDVRLEATLGGVRVARQRPEADEHHDLCSSARRARRRRRRSCGLPMTERRYELVARSYV